MSEPVSRTIGPEKRDVWMRGLFMLMFAFACALASVLLNFITLIQFLWLMFTGQPNQYLVHLGRSLSVWLAEIVRFQCCASDEKPFPWKQWPVVE